jgi:hypothetical protein
VRHPGEGSGLNPEHRDDQRAWTGRKARARWRWLNTHGDSLIPDCENQSVPLPEAGLTILLIAGPAGRRRQVIKTIR